MIPWGDFLRKVSSAFILKEALLAQWLLFFRGSNEVFLYFFGKLLVWSYLGHLLRGSGSADHGIIWSSVNFWALFVLALSTERIENVWGLVFQISYLILKGEILCFTSWSIGALLSLLARWRTSNEILWSQFAGAVLNRREVHCPTKE